MAAAAAAAWSLAWCRLKLSEAPFWAVLSLPGPVPVQGENKQH